MSRIRTPARIALVLMPALLLAACGGNQDPTLGGLDPDEASALNDAAAMLDANSVAPPDDDSATNQTQDQEP